MEHPHYYSSAVWLAPNNFDRRFYERHSTNLPLEGGGHRTIDIMGILSLSSSMRASEGLPDASFQIVRRERLGAETGEHSPDVVDTLMHFYEHDRTFYRFTCRVEQTPDPDSRIRLRDDVDELGVPRIDLNWRIRKEDNLCVGSNV